MVSSERHAGTTPRAETLPSVGFRPTMLPKRRRDAAGAGGVGAKRKADDAGRDRAGGTRGRAARHVTGIEDIARHAIRTARADQSGGELVEIGLADQQRAFVQQALHRGRVVVAV